MYVHQNVEGKVVPIFPVHMKSESVRKVPWPHFAESRNTNLSSLSCSAGTFPPHQTRNMSQITSTCHINLGNVLQCNLCLPRHQIETMTVWI